MVLLSHSMRMTVHRDRKILLFSGSGVVAAGDKKDIALSHRNCFVFPKEICLEKIRNRIYVH